jgi:excinuclease ABC subunit C
MAIRADLEPKLKYLPTGPGVYLFRGEDGGILYVGKAKSLRPRVRSYFGPPSGQSPKTRELVRRVVELETLVVENEAEALILENNLIKEHRPRFNVNLKDDKSYPYIKVTVQEPFPRIYVTRRLIRDGARYFGPYTDVRRMRQTLEAVKKLYTVRSCRYNLPKEAPERPCLDYHIGRCRAPCVALQTDVEYREMIDEVVDVLLGRTRRAATRIRERMAKAAAEMNFEAAAELRDALGRLEQLESRQKVLDVEGADRDVLALARDGEEGCGVVLRIREGRLLGREVQFVTNLQDRTDGEVLGVIATRYYSLRSQEQPDDLPAEILFPHEWEDRGALEALLRDRAGGTVRTRIPRRGEKLSLIELAEQNARHVLEERKLSARAAELRAPDVLYELQEVLGLAVVPRRIVCFDVSHTQGSEAVAAGVLFENGEPNKAEYRKFRVKGDWGNDDFRSMHEVVTRYFGRRLDGGEPMPELVVIDGGKGQLSSARRALNEIGLGEQAVISLAKREEEVFTNDGAGPLRIPRRSASLRLLQRLRDEAHRFAVTYNRTLRTRRTIRSELAQIPGIGPGRQKQLLERFGSMRAVGHASAAEIAGIAGFGPALARKVLAHVHGALGEPVHTEGSVVPLQVNQNVETQ